jgi:hypothetical protein
VPVTAPKGGGAPPGVVGLEQHQGGVGGLASPASWTPAGSRNGGGLVRDAAAMADAARRNARVVSTASPAATPTCWTQAIMPAASPASAAALPCSAVPCRAGRPSPTSRATSIAGTRSKASASCAGTRLSSSSPAAASPNAVQAAGRCPWRVTSGADAANAATARRTTQVGDLTDSGDYSMTVLM